MVAQNSQLMNELFTDVLAPSDGPTLMVIYGIGAALIFLVLAMMYGYALKKKRQLQLSPKEVFDTKTSIINNLLMASVPLISALIAFIGLGNSTITFAVSGIIYYAYIFIMPIFNIRRNKLKAKKWKLNN